LDGNGEPTVDPTTGRVSPFMHSGDPVTNSGWLQYFENPPCDLRMVHGTGTFSIAPLDTLRIVYAIVVGHKDNRINSIINLKRNVNLIRDGFQSKYEVQALAETDVRSLSATEIELKIKADVIADRNVMIVQAELYDYDYNRIHTLELFDDGIHNDDAANDNTFGNYWHTKIIKEALFLNLKVVDAKSKEHLFNKAVENITLIPDSLEISSITVSDDHINQDGKINPGENIRLTFEIINKFSFDLEAISAFIDTKDPYIQFEKHYFTMYDFSSGQSHKLYYHPDDRDSYLSMNVAKDVPDTHTIYFDVTFFDDQHHIWHEPRSFALKVQPFDYVPNQIIPAHVAGHSDAKFVISVINPAELTDHAYTITVSDSINARGDQGLNLIDKTLGDSLLKKHTKPDQYAYNVPITDGFKIVEAYLPENRVRWAYEEAPGGHSNPFWIQRINFGEIEDENFCEVELEFVNYIDSSGVIGDPIGQGGFYYAWNSGRPGEPTSFVPCPFNVWKIDNGQRMNRLNVWFMDYIPSTDGIWTPRDRLYIMKSDYDSSGQYYFDPGNNFYEDIMYDIFLTLDYDSSIVDPGDKIIISREFSATKEDVWMFVPTGIIKRNAIEPKSFALHQNYPNPFNPTTTIRFSVDKASLVTLKIYNIMGQQVIELFHEKIGPGNYTVQWDGKNNVGLPVSSGLYFAELDTQEHSKLIKMLLLR